MRTSLLAALCCALTLSVTPAVASAPSSATVTIKDIDFTPATVTVRKGGSVTWRFADDIVSHNVTSRGTTRFKSSTSKMSGTYKVRFARKGTYRYVCTIHANMAGKVVVR